MWRALAILLLVPMARPASFLETQAKRPVARPAPKQVVPARPALKQVVPAITCPSTLGPGLRTKHLFCDVLIGRNPQDGLVIKIPTHRGIARLLFDLHNRHTYSEQETKAGRAYTQYTATLGVLTMDGTLLTRAVVQSEFRKAADMVDRVGGGAGPSGLKAVAPVGSEPITVEIPQEMTEVSVLGEHLAMVRIDGTDTFVTPGRPIALVSNVRVEYQEPPAQRRKKKKR
jgi:hypothetical protein